MTAPDHKEFCTTAEAANLLGVAHRTIQLWVEAGTLQAWKTAGGHRRISMSSVERLLAARNPAFAAQASPRSAPRPAFRILLVDDDPATLGSYEREMVSWGLPVELFKAADGFEALLKIGENKPDMLISDLNMPGMDGLRMIRTLQGGPAYAGIAIIVISGLEHATATSMGLPADIPYFSKPVSFVHLRSLVEAALPAA